MTFMSAIINFAQNLVMRRRVVAPLRTDSFELCIGGKSTSMSRLINLCISIGWLRDCTRRNLSLRSNFFACGMKYYHRVSLITWYYEKNIVIIETIQRWFKGDLLYKNYRLT